MTVRMKHPEHGWTHAYDTGEKARLEGLGWSVDEPVEPEKEESEPAKRKPGRPKKAE